MNFENSLQKNECVVYLYGINGCLLKKDSFHENTFQFDVSDISKGFYILKIDTGNRKISKLIIKQ
jgi:hypothetical protein